MADIRTTTEEFSTSGSLSKVKEEVTNPEPVKDSQETIQFLVKKIDELKQNNSKFGEDINLITQMITSV